MELGKEPLKKATFKKLEASYVDLSETSCAKSLYNAEKLTSFPQGEYADLQSSKETTGEYMWTGFSTTRKPTLSDYQSLDASDRPETTVYTSPGDKTTKHGTARLGRFHNQAGHGLGKRGPGEGLVIEERKPTCSSFNSGSEKSTSVITLDSRFAVVLGFIITVSVFISIGAAVLAGITFHKASKGSKLQSDREDALKNRTMTIIGKGTSEWRKIYPREKNFHDRFNQASSIEETGNGMVSRFSLFFFGFLCPVCAHGCVCAHAFGNVVLRAKIKKAQKRLSVDIEGWSRFLPSNSQQKVQDTDGNKS